MILPLALFVQLRLVTDGQTRDICKYRAIVRVKTVEEEMSRAHNTSDNVKQYTDVVANR